MEITELLGPVKIVPVVVLNDGDSAVPLAETLRSNGINVIEVTLRSDEALSAIEKIAAEVPEITVGAGSIRNETQVMEAKNAGAEFLVSPGATNALIESATDAKLPFVPGAASPSEMIRLLERGFRLQKFFPAEQLGGIAMLKSLRGPLPEISFFPTGGIGPELAGNYLSLVNVRCIGGSWLTPAKLLQAGDFKAIGRLAREAVALSESEA